MRRAPGPIAAADRVGERLEGGRDVVADAGQDVHVAAVRDEVARPVGIGEERHRRPGAGDDEVPQLGQLGDGELGQVGEPFDRRQPGAPFEVGRERLAEQAGVGGLGRPGRGSQPAGSQRATAEEEGGRLTGPQGPGRGLDRVRRGGRPGRPWAGGDRSGRRPTTRRRPGGRAWRRHRGVRVTRRPRRPRRRPRYRARRSGPTPRPSQRGRRCPTRSGASYRLWYVAWSPTMLTTGLWARRALCRLASPFPRPGPRWRRVAAGRPAIRP